ncbi:MAG: DUF4198 domain-containing protein [Desulfobulbaceae bacterium]|nr:DUF4198 domain-containing protein [Desulfobulbaceae bacterium]
MKLKAVLIASLFGLLPAFFSGIAFADVIWLSEVPPSKHAATAKANDTQHDHQHDEAQVKSAPAIGSVKPIVTGAKTHDHGGGTEVDASGEIVDNTHSGNKRIWLRSGNDPGKSAYTGTGNDSETLTLLSQEGSLPDAAMQAENGMLSAKIDLPKLGFYNAYLTERMVHEDMLHLVIAKAELLYGTCAAKNVDEEEVAKPIINANVPLELVREHYAEEGLFTRIVSGDKVNFTVMSYGKPAAGATVSFTTQNGWCNTKVSDAEGRVSFTMVRDYFPVWHEFKKRHQQTFLVVADWDAPGKVVSEGVTYASAHYTSTLAGAYFPSPHDYRSYAWGLGISLFVIVFGGLSIYIYRRRLKPYKEERIDEKD